MYSLQRFHGSRFARINSIIDGLDGHITGFVDLIGSSTLPLPEVCQIQGMPATACRVEGYVGSRLFPGTNPMDQAEDLIIESVRKLFDLDGDYVVNVQPHSATQANQAILIAILGNSESAIVGVSPSDGGHISHSLGAPSSSKFVAAPVGDDGINYDRLETVVATHRPTMIIIGGTSYTRSVDYARLRDIADSVGAHLHADIAHTAPFVAAGVHPPAFPHVDSATIDPSKNLRGSGGGILIFRSSVAKEVNRAVFPILQSSPNQVGILAKAACLSHWTQESLKPYALRMVGLAKILSERLETSLGPPYYGDTETHLLLFDVNQLPGDGRTAEVALERARILANRNQIPGDTRPHWAPSGIRFGTTALTILGYSDEDARDLGDAICSVLTGEGEPEETISGLIDRYNRDLTSTASGQTSATST